MSGLGKILVILGLITTGLGIVFLLSSKIPWLGKLPGDIFIQRKNFTFFFPLTTCLLISLILSLILWLWLKR